MHRSSTAANAGGPALLAEGEVIAPDLLTETAENLHTCSAPCTAEAVDIDSVADTVERVVLPVQGSETVQVGAASGRIVQCAIASTLPLPPFAHSAVDGFGLRSAYSAAPGKPLPIAGRVRAGDSAVACPSGSVVQLMTGAPIPLGCDAVVKREHAQRRANDIVLTDVVRSGANIRDAGEDVQRGDVIVQPGTCLDARHIALLSACGIADVEVTRRVRVAIAAFGNELCQPGAMLQPGQIFDSNSGMAEAFFSGPSVQIVRQTRVRDSQDGARDLLRELCSDADLIVTSGGMAGSEEDHTRSALEEAGGTWRLPAIRMKPGKPAGVGVIGSTVVLSLPGNPFAALAALAVIGTPLLAALAGSRRRLPWQPARSDFSLDRKPGRTELFPAKLIGFDAGGAPVLDRLGKGGSARLAPLVAADGLGRVEAEVTSVSPGGRLQFVPFSALFV